MVYFPVYASFDCVLLEKILIQKSTFQMLNFLVAVRMGNFSVTSENHMWMTDLSMFQTFNYSLASDGLEIVCTAKEKKQFWNDECWNDEQDQRHSFVDVWQFLKNVCTQTKLVEISVNRYVQYFLMKWRMRKKQQQQLCKRAHIKYYVRLLMLLLWQSCVCHVQNHNLFVLWFFLMIK